MPTVFTLIAESDLPASPRDHSAAFTVAGIALAFWPVGPWYLARLRDGSDDPLGLLALATAVCFLWWRRHRIALSASGGIVALGAILLGMVWHRQLPPMAEAALAVAALCSAFALPRRQPGIAMLLVLSLPLVASMQFYFGYPLRLSAALLTQAALRIVGCDVLRLGTDLVWHGAQVGVDPPCSGVRMLWIGCFVVAALSARSGLKTMRLLVLASSTVLIVVLANALRATLLVPSEAGVMMLPSGWHEGIGIAVMVPTFYALVRLHDRLVKHQTHKPTSPTHQPTAFSSWLPIIALGLGIAACVLHGFFDPHGLVKRTSASPAWPSTFEGKPLEAMPLTQREQVFAESFPGSLARFRCNQDELVLRNVTQATRQLHSSRDCFRAAGYDITSLAQTSDAAGRRWSRFQALRDDEELQVRECVTSAHGASWHDISAWYWDATFHSDQGPWLAMTVIERVH
jgi:exosortase/archaeosortase family protein